MAANLFFYRNLVYPVTRGQFTAAASQNLAELWRGSNSAGKRELLDVVFEPHGSATQVSF